MACKNFNLYVNIHKLSFIGTQPFLFLSVSPMAMLEPQWQSCVVVMENLWPAKSNCLFLHLYEKCVESYFGLQRGLFPLAPSLWFEKNKVNRIQLDQAKVRIYFKVTGMVHKIKNKNKKQK